MFSGARKSSCKATRGEAGFALYEVMIALAILGLAAAAATTAVTSSLNRGSQARAVSAATLEAQSVLSRIGQETPLKPGETLIEMTGGRTARVRVSPAGDLLDQMAPPADQAPRVRVYRVALDVADADGNTLVHLVTYRLAGTP